MAIELTKDNFEQEVLESSEPVLIDFWATWCMPCRMLAPVIEELAEEVQGAKVCKINIDEEPELAEQFGIMSIPTLVVMRDGEAVQTVVGLQQKQAVLDMLSV